MQKNAFLSLLIAIAFSAAIAFTAVLLYGMLFDIFHAVVEKINYSNPIAINR